MILNDFFETGDSVSPKFKTKYKGKWWATDGFGRGIYRSEDVEINNSLLAYHINIDTPTFSSEYGFKKFIKENWDFITP